MCVERFCFVLLASSKCLHLCCMQVATQRYNTIAMAALLHDGLVEYLNGPSLSLCSPFSISDLLSLACPSFQIHYQQTQSSILSLYPLPCSRSHLLVICLQFSIFVVLSNDIFSHIIPQSVHHHSEVIYKKKSMCMFHFFIINHPFCVEPYIAFSNVLVVRVLLLCWEPC